MIKYTKGNIFDAEPLREGQDLILVNPVNTVGVMGAGLAKQFKERYPVMFRLYKGLCNRGELKVGYPKNVVDGGDIICLFPTKKHWREKSKIEYIENGLEAIAFERVWFAKPANTTLVFPKIGCGLGGLNWSEVRPLIECYLGAHDVIIYE